MNKEQSKLVTLYIEDADIYVCYLKALPMFLVQVKTIDQAPKEIASLLEVMILYSIKSGNVDKGENSSE